MTTSTLSAASAALDALLSGPQSVAASKQRRKKTSKRAHSFKVIINPSDLDPEAKAQHEAEEQKRIEEAVKALKRSSKIKPEEMEVRERILAMREEKLGKKGTKRKAVAVNFDDSD